MWYLRNKKAFLDAVPEEMKSITMGEGFRTLYHYRPNNYSIKIPLKTSLSLVAKAIEGVKQRFQCKPKPMRNWTGWTIKNYHGCTVEINTKQVIFYWTRKTVRLVYYPNVEKQVEGIKKDIEDKIVKVAKRFQKETKIKLGIRNWKKHRKEIGIKGDKKLDSAPTDMNIHSEIFKKVYEKEFEFFDETYWVNFVNNRALENLSPKLIEELVTLRKLICSSMTTMNAIANTQLMIAQTLKRLEERTK